MGIIDTIISILKKSSEWDKENLLRINNLIIALRKILYTFNETAYKDANVQKGQMKIIENIFIENPTLLDDKSFEDYFDIHAKIQTGIELFPINASYEGTFRKLLNAAYKTRKIKKIKLRIFNILLLLVLFIAMITACISGVALIKISLNKILN